MVFKLTGTSSHITVRQGYQAICRGRNQSGKALVTLMIVLTVLAMLGGGGYWAYEHYFQEKPRLKLGSVKVKPEVMDFVYRYMPKVHSLVISLDDDIVLMDSETKRLTSIAKKFPDQTKLVNGQLELIKKTRATVAETLNYTMGRIQTIYVTWLIDPVRGKRALAEDRRDLIRKMLTVRKSSGRLLARLRTASQRS